MSPNPDPNKPIGLRDLKHHPKGASKLGYDGVLRSFDGERNVFDTIGLSPFQLKYFLDRHNQWSQETEDRYRGVDGTKVTDHEALYNPPDEMRLPKLTEEEKAATRKLIEEHNRKLMERVE